jgi:hypothetical protein
MNRNALFAVFIGGLGLTVGWITNDAFGGENVAALRAEQNTLKAQRNALASQKRVAKALREALACEKREVGLKRTLTEGVKVTGDQWQELRRLRSLVKATRPPENPEPDVDQLYHLLQMCCDWPHLPLSEEGEDCRQLMFGDHGEMGQTFPGPVRWWGNKRPTGPPPAPLNIEVD